jgi:excinuclease UvrABC ATPase subunit
MAEVVSVCEVCEGRRYTDEVLEYRLRGRNIVEVLAMSVEEAAGFFTEKPVKAMLDRLADVDNLLGLLDRLVESGKSVVVIEHHQAVMAHGDWIIDLGPGAGHDGGKVVFEGTPAELVADRSTLTGEHLATYVGA